MTPTQRNAMQRAVSAYMLLLPTLPGLNDKGQRWLRNELIAAMDDLNNALKEDNEVTFDKVEPAPEPEMHDPNAPYQGMIDEFEAHYGQSFTEDWRK